MFGFGKKGKVVENLPEVRDLMKELIGATMNVYVGATVGYLLSLGKAAEDVEKARTELLSAIQKYVQAEILLERQKNEQGPSLAELAGLCLR